MHLATHPDAALDHRDQDQESLLHFAASFGRESCLRALVAAVNSVNVTNNLGATPLTLAFSEGALPCARALLELGADPTLRGEPVNIEETGPAMDALCAATLSQDPQALALSLGFAQRCDRNLIFAKNPIPRCICGPERQPRYG